MTWSVRDLSQNLKKKQIKIKESHKKNILNQFFCVFIFIQSNNKKISISFFIIVLAVFFYSGYPFVQENYHKINIRVCVIILLFNKFFIDIFQLPLIFSKCLGKEAFIKDAPILKRGGWIKNVRAKFKLNGQNYTNA